MNTNGHKSCEDGFPEWIRSFTLAKSRVVCILHSCLFVSIRGSSVRQNVSQIEIHQRGIKQQTVEQVEDSADARKIVAGVLHSRLALEQRLNEITDHRRCAQ